MQLMHQTEWFDIQFSSFAKCDSRKIADATFYDKFYEKFYQKYASYDDLPEEWKKAKYKVAEFIDNCSSKDDKIVSIGSGNGFVESCLANLGRNVVAIEPSETASKFLKPDKRIRLLNGYFPECLNESKEAYKSFDFGYMCATEYVFNDNELVTLLNSIREFPVRTFLLISVCVYENSTLIWLKNLLKRVLLPLGLYKSDSTAQLWGYMRTPSEFTEVFKKSGFSNIESGFISQNTYWIKGNGI